MAYQVRVPKFRDPKAEKLRLYAQRGPFVGQVIRSGPYTHRVVEIRFHPDWTVWVRTRNSVGWYVTKPTNWQHWRTANNSKDADSRVWGIGPC